MLALMGCPRQNGLRGPRADGSRCFSMYEGTDSTPGSLSHPPRAVGNFGGG